MKNLLTKEQETRIVREIQALETRTTGEVRVCVTQKWIWRIESFASKVFRQLGMDQTVNRNGALIVLFARRRKFCVLGDVALTERAGEGFWENVASVMEERLREGQHEAAIISGLEMIGDEMARHWPGAGAHDINELPDSVVTDKELGL